MRLRIFSRGLKELIRQMAHESEDANRLTVETLDMASLADLPSPTQNAAEVWLFVLPFGRTVAAAALCEDWFAALQRFSESLNDQSIIAILTSAQDAAETWPQLSERLKFQLWVVIRLSAPIIHDPRQLPEHHAALLILSKYRSSLRHTKTRIAYTFCPACDRTTKDYGGKKHTYHAYGTLLSDIWRDLAWTPDTPADAIAIRLADLFGLETYDTIRLVDLSRVDSLRPALAKPDMVPTRARGSRTRLKSQLINGDCLTELRKIPANSVEFCFADPPYNLDKRYDAWDDAIDVTDYVTWCDAWLDELARVLRPGCTCAVLNIPLWAIRHFQRMKQRLIFQAWVAWEGLSLPVRMIMPAHYAIVCFSKGVPRALPGLATELRTEVESESLATIRENYCLRVSCMSRRESDREPISDLWWDIHRLKHNSRRVDHPCQLPPALMRRLIALFTERDELVLDPFNGSGTTTLCADGLQRRYIGIEFSEYYHALAQSRHDFLHAGGDPFEKVARTPKAKNSRVARIGGTRYKVPKKTLQLEVRRVAHLLGRLPSRDELERHGRFPIHYYDEYFISWGEVCAAARTTGMSETRSVAASQVISDQPTLFDGFGP